MHSSDAQEHIGVEETRRRFWLNLYPYVTGVGAEPLSDWELSLVAVILFLTGQKSAPGQETLKGMTKVCEAIGSVRHQGSRAAKRPLVTKASNSLYSRGLLSRRVDDRMCLWTLIPRQSGSAQSEWPGAYDYCARLWRRKQVPGGSQVRAAATRLSFCVDSEGKWRGTPKELAEVLQVKSPLTAERRVSELQLADKAIKATTELVEGQVQVTIQMSAPEPLLSADEYRTLARELISELWYPELVNEAITRAAKQLKSGKVTPARGVNGFYRPVLALQEQFNNPGLLKYALEETLKGVLDNPKTDNWHRYTLAICKNNRRRFPLSGDEKRQDPETQLRTAELAMRELLTEAARANGVGDTASARELLKAALADADSLAPLFQGDSEKVQQAIQLAFKQGATDCLAAKPDKYALDFLPEWQPGQPVTV